MVAVFNKELLSWYLITLKLNQTIETSLQNTTNSRSIEPTEENNQISIEEQTARPNSPEPEWVIQIKQTLDQAQNDDEAGLWAKLSIYKIPQCLRENDDKAYIPQTVSLGPYHHNKKRLRNMNPHKWRALNHILKRTNQKIELYLEAIKELEEKERACYEGPICLSSIEFIEMMVLDACFVLELFRGAAGGFTRLGYSRNDPVFAMRGTMHSIQRDMIMLENQIPLFVLDKLYGIQSGQPEQKGEVARKALQFFYQLISADADAPKSDSSELELSLEKAHTFNPLADQDGLHCLEVFRRGLLKIQAGPKQEPRVRSGMADKRRQQLIHCVTKLKDSGIKFNGRKTDRFWDIKFENGILEIPCLLIHDGTKSLFLNLIAFEQCHLDCTNDITSYVFFMDNLIDSPADVSYLHDCGIIENWLGSDGEAAELFNRLGQEVVFDRNDSSLSSLSEQVNEYHKKKWNAWWASLEHKYFDSPWSIISLFAAVILLVLTLVQTFYSVYGYYMPNS